MNEAVKKDVNKVWIRGEMIEPVTISHHVDERTFWKTKVSYTRQSGIKDIIPVVLQKHLDAKVGDIISVNGTIRIVSFLNNGERQRDRYVYAYTAVISDKEDPRDSITLEGTVVRDPVYRTTPKGCEISDLMIRSGKNNIPCICWWDNAHKAKDLAIGANVRIRGSIQSREYARRHDNNIEVKRIIEVSVGLLDVLDEDENAENIVISAPDQE